MTRSSHLDVFCANGALKDLAKFSRKHLCQSLFFDKVVGLAAFVRFENNNAPMKKKFVRANGVPYMTKTLRQAIMTG